MRKGVTWLKPLKRVLVALIAALSLVATAVPAGAQGEPISYESEKKAAQRNSSSMYNVVDQINARSLWQQGITGEGIDVAVIDTGVAPVPALTGADKVVAMVDLSFEAGIPEATFLDTYGHGSHMAGIIAGSDPGGDPATAHERPKEFHGVAPGAGIVSVKVGDNTGAVDVSQVIAAIDWVIEHKDEGDLNIRVINLSYGTDSTQDPEIDPLSHAVERAWHAGIVVVVAAGNGGKDGVGLSNPASNPYVIAVGAAKVKNNGSVTVPGWSARAWKVNKSNRDWLKAWDADYKKRGADLVAPGDSIRSLRVPGSRIGMEETAGRVNETIQRGTGTSQATAVVSGAAALLLQARPDLTPDQVKALLMDSADSIDGARANRQGAGLIDVGAAAAMATPDAVQNWTRSTGTGSLDAARGSARVVIHGEELVGETTVTGADWDADAWLEAAGSTWTGSTWTGSTWTGSTWTGSTWTGSTWTGSTWTGSTWTGSTWTGSTWTGSTWTGSTWTGSTWTGSTWTGSSWTGSTWTGSTWTGSTWTGSTWTGSTWTNQGWHGSFG
ncbi:MAG: S8 family serine peptidase [Actinomycetota bacterium]